MAIVQCTVVGMLSSFAPLSDHICSAGTTTAPISYTVVRLGCYIYYDGQSEIIVLAQCYLKVWYIVKGVLLVTDY